MSKEVKSAGEAVVAASNAPIKGSPGTGSPGRGRAAKKLRAGPTVTPLSSDAGEAMVGIHAEAAAEVFFEVTSLVWAASELLDENKTDRCAAAVLDATVTKLYELERHLSKTSPVFLAKHQQLKAEIEE